MSVALGRGVPSDTARLAFREMSPADLDFVAAMLGDPRVMRHYPQVYSRAEAADWLRRQIERYERDGHGLWLVSERDGGAAVGQIGLVVQEIEGEALLEIAYLLRHESWGRGYATEAAAACRDHAFVLGAARVVSLVRPVNEASQAVARRIGMLAGRRVAHHGLEHILFARDNPRAAPARR